MFSVIKHTHVDTCFTFMKVSIHGTTEYSYIYCERFTGRVGIFKGAFRSPKKCATLENLPKQVTN